MRPPAQRREVLRPALVAGRVVGTDPAEPEELLRELSLGLRRASGSGKTRVAQASVGQAQIVPRRRASRRIRANVQVAAAVVGGNALGREDGDHVELVFAHHLDDRDVLFAERT